MQEGSEYVSPVVPIEKGRKNRKPKKEPCKNSLQVYVAKFDCVHLKNDKIQKRVCESSILSFDDLSLFSHHLKSCSSKVDQDKFLLKYMQISYPIRKRTNKEIAIKPHATAVKYFIRNRANKRIHVCAQLFKNVTGASQNRLSLLARYHLHAMDIPKERRGGNRSTTTDGEVSEAVRKHISSFYCRESHYSRNKTKRSYLPPELNIKKMFDMFVECQEQNGRPKCSLAKYKKIFYSNFNLGFGNPHTDTCSTCKTFDVQFMKFKNDSTRLQEERTKKKLHILRAKKFHTIMNKPEEGTVDIIFDLQQNQPLPKLSVGEVFYSRQVWLYNMGIVNHKPKQSKENITFYTWLETDGPRGANEVASIVINFLENLENDLKQSAAENGTAEVPSKLRLFSDSCASQNKNTIMMTALMYFLEKSTIFSDIKHYFPIRGHSYMPPDRVFGRIEKCYRKKENIVSPNEYFEILQKHGNLRQIGVHWKVVDFKKVSKQLFKTKLPFKISSSRVITYNKEDNKKVVIGVSNTYIGLPIIVEPLKRNISSVYDECCHLDIVPKANKVSEKKMIDVKKLMQFFVIPDDAQEFYRDILSGVAGDSIEDQEKFYDEQENCV